MVGVPVNHKPGGTVEESLLFQGMTGEGDFISVEFLTRPNNNLVNRLEGEAVSQVEGKFKSIHQIQFEMACYLFWTNGRAKNSLDNSFQSTLILFCTSCPTLLCLNWLPIHSGVANAGRTLTS